MVIVDVYKSFYDGEHNFCFEIKEVCNLSSVKIIFLAVTGESIFIKIVRNTENIAKENVSKKVCDRESQ